MLCCIKPQAVVRWRRRFTIRAARLAKREARQAAKEAAKAAGKAAEVETLPRQQFIARADGEAEDAMKVVAAQEQVAQRRWRQKWDELTGGVGDTAAGRVRPVATPARCGRCWAHKLARTSAHTHTQINV